MQCGGTQTSSGSRNGAGRAVQGVLRGALGAPRTPLPGCPAPLLPSPGLRSDPVQGVKRSPKVTLTQTVSPNVSK